MFDFAQKIFNSAKKSIFNKNMKEVYSNINSAWKFIKLADEYYSQGNKDYSNGVRLASEYLLDSYKYLSQATSCIPKYDLEAKMEVVEVIMKIGDPVMYDYIYPRFRSLYKFKNKKIQKEWEEQVGFFVKYSKKDIEYEKILKEYPYSSLLKDFKQ